MKQLKYFMLVFVSLLSISMFGQGTSFIVSGTVYSDVEGKLISLQVVELDKSGRILSATATDNNGDFSLRIKNSENQIRFSYIGYKTRTFPIGNTRQFNVKMEDNTALSEIVVKSKKVHNDGTLPVPLREVSGAVQKINTKEFEGLSVASIDDALQGRIAGLDIVGNSGDLGAGMSLKIRGTTSINGNSQPLIVLNDVPYESEVASSFDYSSANQEQYANLLNINMDDIEEITVLKDGASAAIWGARGANGVICIKTKKGVKGPTRITYSYKLSGATQPRGLNVLNGDDYTMLMKQAYFNPNQDETAGNLPEYNYDPTFSEYENFNNNTDWVKAVSQYGFTNDHTLTASGGGDKANFRASVGYYDQTGIIIGQDMQRYTARMNLDYQVTDRMKFTSEFSLAYTNNNKNWQQSWDSPSLLDIAYKKMPNVSIYEQDTNGDDTNVFYNVPQSSSLHSDQRDLMNPVAVAELAKYNEKNIRIIPTMRLQYDLLDPDVTMLRYNGYVSIDVDNTMNTKFLPKEVTSKSWKDESVNRSYANDVDGLTVQAENSLTWQPKISQDHSLMAYAAWQIRSGSSHNQEFEKYGLPSGAITDVTSTGFYKTVKNGDAQWRSMAVLGRIHYSYLGKYVLDGTIRRDGSTRFGDKKRWGNFPALSGKWIMSDENFMKPTQSWLNELGIRLGWGVTGNQPDKEYLYYSRYGGGWSYTSNYIDIPTIRPVSIKLSDLQWEKSTSINLGTDIHFLDDKFLVDINVYHRRTEDMLFKDQAVPTTTGFGSVSYMNVGTMDNDGWEFNLSTNKMLKHKDFSFDITLNLSNYINTIVDLKQSVLDSYNGDFNYENGSYLSRVQVNNSFGSIYGFRYKGVYQYSEYVEGREGTSPVARDEKGNVVLDEEGKAVPMYFAYGKGSSYKFTGGDAIYEDINHDGTIDELDIVYLGNSHPKINGGFSATLRWKNFSVSSFCNFRAGNKIVNYARMYAENMYYNDNQSVAVNWRWRKEGDDTQIPRALYRYGYNWLGSDRFVEDGSFLRIKYVTFNYALSSKVVKRMNMNQLNFYLTLNNVATFTRYNGVDPEISEDSFGISADKSKTPRSKYFTLGITAGF